LQFTVALRSERNSHKYLFGDIN